MIATMNGAALNHMSHGRRPLTIAAFAFSAIFLAFALHGGAPWWVLPPILFATLATGYMVVFDPKSGIVIDSKRIQIFSGRWTRTVKLDDLESIAITDWAEGPPSATAHLKDGSTIYIPSVCLPDKARLLAAAASCGIQVT